MATQQQKQHPMPFSGEMVKALRDRRKTQSRCLITTTNSAFDGRRWPRRAMTFDWNAAHVDPGPSPAGNPGPYLHLPCPLEETSHRIYPRVQVGDTLWVREALYRGDNGDWRYRVDDETVMVTEADKGAMLAWTHHKDGAVCSPCFMPRFACRMELVVSEVRVHRLQDITQRDARAEGFPFHPLDARPLSALDPVDWFSAIWNSINGDKGNGWDANRWVFAYTFSMEQGGEA